MKKRTIIFLLAIVLTISISGFTIISNKMKSSNGTKVAYTNSPHDGTGDCTSCHGGGTVTPVITISSTPLFGAGNTYVPGTIYTMSYKVTGYPKFGFDIELNDGDLTTSMGAGTNVALTNCYVTPNPYSAGYPANLSHTAPIFSTDDATWQWTAPASGTVYIYSVGLGVNGTGSTSGDKMAQKNLILTPTTSTGIDNNTNDQFNLVVYPNPATENIHLKYFLMKSSKVTIQIINIKGQVIETLLNEKQNAGEQNLNSNISNLSKGLYTINLTVEGLLTVKKLVVQ